MKVTKLVHSCLLVEERNARMLIDPGCWSLPAQELSGIDAIFITHEHDDHCFPESLQKILTNNPAIPIYTNTGVGVKLKKAGIAFHLLEDGGHVEVKEVPVEAFGRDHALIYKTFPRFDNTGFLIANRLFHPGDALDVVPLAPVEILALPIIAPWARIADSLDYVQKINPKFAIAVHDGFLKFRGPYESVPNMVMKDSGVHMMFPDNGEKMEF